MLAASVRFLGRAGAAHEYNSHYYVVQSTYSCICTPEYIALGALLRVGRLK